MLQILHVILPIEQMPVGVEAAAVTTTNVGTTVLREAEDVLALVVEIVAVRVPVVVDEKGIVLPYNRTKKVPTTSSPPRARKDAARGPMHLMNDYHGRWAPPGALVWSARPVRRTMTGLS